MAMPERSTLHLATPDVVGETTITGKNQISLPTHGLRRLGWQKGDRLIVEVVSDNVMVLMRRPESWADAFSGKMGDVFGDHEGTLRFLAEERQSWADWEQERGI